MPCIPPFGTILPPPLVSNASNETGGQESSKNQTDAGTQDQDGVASIASRFKNATAPTTGLNATNETGGLSPDLARAVFGDPEINKNIINLINQTGGEDSSKNQDYDETQLMTIDEVVKGELF